MHNPQHPIALVAAAQYVVEQMNKRGLFAAHHPGYLSVMNRNLFLLGLNHIGTLGQLCTNSDIEYALKVRCGKVFAQIDSDGRIPDGTTSSFVGPIYGGAVAAKQLIIAWASQDGMSNPQEEEAVAIRIAVKAGLLEYWFVVNRFCDPLKPNYNEPLGTLLRYIN